MPSKNNRQAQHMGRLLLAASVVIAGGCSAVDTDQKQLKEEIRQLQSENSSLKAKLTELSEKRNTLSEAQKAATAGGDNNSTANKSAENQEQKQKQEPSISYTDLNDCPNKEMIDDLAKLNVFADGDSADTKFNPYRPITRGQYVTWLYRAYNAIQPAERRLRPSPQLAQQFSDVAADNPAYQYVQALANAGYSIGYKDGTFRPDKPLTREEMMGIKVALDCGKDLPPYRSQMECVWKFSDGKQVDERFTGYVHQDYYISGPKGNNIQRAFGKIGTFHPKQAVLRCEAAGSLWQEGQFGFNGPINAAAVGHS